LKRLKVTWRKKTKSPFDLIFHYINAIILTMIIFVMTNTISVNSHFDVINPIMIVLLIFVTACYVYTSHLVLIYIGLKLKN